jgi:uncharacterized membrane protein
MSMLSSNTRLTPAMLATGAIFGALAGSGVGAVIAPTTGAASGAAAGAIASAIAMWLLTRRSSSSSRTLAWLTGVAAVSCGLMAGFFFTFSVLVMDALAQQPPEAGIRVMQAINVVVFNPWFGVAFSGTPAACVLVMNAALGRWRQPGARLGLVGGALYITGTLWVTVLCNVPRNDALAAVTAGDPVAADLWASYLVEWTRWNHVRTIAAMAAAAVLTLVLASAATKGGDS